MEGSRVSHHGSSLRLFFHPFATVHPTHIARRKKREREERRRLYLISSLFLFLGVIYPHAGWAQPGNSGNARDTGSVESSHLTLSGSADIYYAHYNDSLSSESFRQTGAISPRSDQFGLNIAQVRLAYDHPSVRGRIALHYGDIPLSGWSSDFPIVQEATLGVSLSEGLWVDGGFFPTHIGTESFQPGINRISSIAAITFFEPFYQSGVRLAWEGSERFGAQLHLLSGFNRFVDQNSSKSIGTWLSWHPSQQVALVYAALFGNEAPDSATAQFRTYHNVQVAIEPSDNFRMILGFDFCSQSHTAANGGTATMNGGLLLIGYDPSPMWRINTRLEFLNDREGFIAGTYRNGADEIVRTNLVGATVGIEHKPTETSYVRLEGRLLQTPEATGFFGGNGVQRQRMDLSITAGVAFDALLF